MGTACIPVHVAIYIWPYGTGAAPTGRPRPVTSYACCKFDVMLQTLESRHMLGTGSAEIRNPKVPWRWQA